MWKIDFYVLPSSSYNDISDTDIEKLGEKVEYLKKNENLYVPDEIYDVKDKNGVTMADFIFGNEQNDVSDYLLQIISKQTMCPDTYDEIKQKTEYGYLPMTRYDIDSDIAHLCIDNIKDTEEDKALKVNDVVKVKRYYISKVDSYKIYEDRAKLCYPNLVFLEDAFKYAEGLGKCADVVEELTRHLTVLNDVGNKLYIYYNKDEKAVLSELKSGYDLECSGKGSNEEQSYNKEIIYNNRKYQLTCNPHTKLYKKKTDKRIYFCWGRDEIENHNIIIVRIGRHWQE